MQKFSNGINCVPLYFHKWFREPSLAAFFCFVDHQYEEGQPSVYKVTHRRAIQDQIDHKFEYRLP